MGGGGGHGGGGKGSGPSTAPPNVPDGRDDDVIARQIREAAEKETDPELKEKLWKEYIEYKKNVQGK
jgi:chorismate mutase